MKLSPFFKYFGSKYRSAKLYPAPRHDVIREDFCGGAGYSLNHPERRVILRDSDERVVRIWRYLIAATPDEIMALPLIEIGQDVRTLDLPSDAKLLLSCNINTSPFRNIMSRWEGGGDHGFWSARKREKVASQVNAIKHWQVEHGSYVDSPNDECTRFVDPPYEALAMHYREKKINFTELAEWCKSRRGQTIVCEQTGASWLPFRHLATVSAVRNKSGRTCSEAIWTNDMEVKL